MAANIRDAKERKIDVGRAHFVDDKGQQRSRLFLNVASLGLSAEVVRRVNAGTAGGALAYSLATLATVLKHHRPDVQITCAETQKIYKNLNMLAIANGGYFGGGMHIAPNARVDDGAFDLVSVRGWSPMNFMLRAAKVFAGTHLDLPGVDELRELVDISVNVERSPDAVHIELDGENVGRLPARFTVLPGALRLQM